MKDIGIKNGVPSVTDTIVHKAVNVLRVQEGSLHYAKEFGIDLDQFFSPDVNIQTESFKSYAVQKLAENGVNVIGVDEVERTLDAVFKFSVTEQQTEGLVSK